MFKEILVATDGSDLASKALSTGLELSEALKARMIILTVIAPFPMPAYGSLPTGALIAAYDRATAENTQRILADAKAAAARVGVSCETLHVTNADTAQGILETAKAKNCDLIVMASHGRRGVKRLLLGSVASKVVTLSDLPVLICR